LNKTTFQPFVTRYLDLLTPGIHRFFVPAPKKKKCKNTMKFSPNAQAVFMGQKLGQAISEGFGNGSQGVQEFSEGIDTHICNYSE
ncbi:hypothetical protein OESDEN_02787, partial [Oesophagostomum dentatum]